MLAKAARPLRAPKSHCETGEEAFAPLPFHAPPFSRPRSIEAVAERISPEQVNPDEPP